MNTAERIFIKIAKVIGLLVLVVLGAEFACLVLSLPVWMIIKAEQAYDVYPLISKETISLKGEMQENYEDFHVACKEQGDVYSPVEKRKKLAQKAGFRIYTALLLGTTYTTHSTWVCGTDGTINLRIDLNPLK